MVLTPAPAGADPSDEALLFEQLTTARAQHRIAPVARSAVLDTIARRHAARVAAAPQPFHNPGLRTETGGWVAVGEVVGRITAGPGWDSRLQQLFLSSPTHRRVALGTGFTMVGIGAVRSADGNISAVEVLGRPSSTAPPRSPAPRRAARAGSSVTRVPEPAPPPPPTTTTVPLSRLALAPVPAVPPPSVPAPAARASAVHAGASAPVAAGALAGQLVVLGALVALVSGKRSRPAGRRRPWC
jgi:hypothetical protein